MRQWVISYQWQRCSVQQKFPIATDLNKTLPNKNEGTDTWHIFLQYISKLSKDMHSVAVDYAYVLDLCFQKKLMKVKNTNNSRPDVMGAFQDK